MSKVTLIACVTFGAFVLSAVAIVANRHTSHQALDATRAQTVTNCKQIEAVKTVIRGVLHASDVLLGTKGEPGYIYYKSHPDELIVAHQRNKETIAKFAPLSCVRPPD